MPTLSEMFIGGIQQQEGRSLDSSSGAAVGAQLAHMKMERETQMAQLQQKQQELQVAKFEKVGKWFDDYAKMPDGGAKQAFGKNFIPQGIQALGLQDKVNPIVTDMMLKDSQLATGLTSLVRQGVLKVTDLQNPEKIAQVYPEAASEGARLSADFAKQMGDAEEQSLDRQTQIDNSKRSAANAGIRGSGVQDRADNTNLMNLTNRFNTAVAKSKDRLTAAQNIELLLNAKNPMSDSAVRTQLARLSGEVGPLSDFDVKTWSGDPSILARTQQWLNLASEGKLTEANRAQMREVAVTLRQVAQNRIKSEAKRTARLGANVGIDEATMNDSIALDEIIGKDTGAKTLDIEGVKYPESNWAELEKRAKANPGHAKSKKILAALKKARGE